MPRNKTTETTPKTVIKCSITGTEKQTSINVDGTPCLPTGWKRHNDTIYSPEALRETFYIRGLTVPVEKAILNQKGKSFDNEKDVEEGWRELKKELSNAWRRCAQVGNFVNTWLAKEDSLPITINDKGKQELPKFSYDNKKLYKEATKNFKDLPAQCVAEIIRVETSFYFANRRATRLLCEQALRTTKYPTPMKLSAQATPLEIEGSEVYVRCMVGRTKFIIKLREHHARKGKDGTRQNIARVRQMDPIRKAARGELMRGGVSFHPNHDGQVLCTVAVHMEKNRQKLSEEVMTVFTDPKCLLVAEIGDRRLFALNEDALKQWHIAHHCRVRRMSQDLKWERRLDRQTKRNMKRRLEEWCEKHHRRVTDRLHKVARTIADHASRRRVGTVVYLDKCKDYIQKFPWARLKGLLKEKLDENNIKMICEGGEGEPQQESA